MDSNFVLFDDKNVPSETAKKIVQMLAHGMTQALIAEKIGRNRRTLEADIAKLLFWYECANSTELVYKFMKNKLIE
jgi:DNA-binding NarL/FixJ family response regulator